MDRDAIEIIGIDSLVPKDHLLRKTDQAVDFKRIYEMVKLLYVVLVQHPYGLLPSLRRAAEEVHLNTAYRWFLGYITSEV